MDTSVVRLWCYCHKLFIEIFFSLISFLVPSGKREYKKGALTPRGRGKTSPAALDQPSGRRYHTSGCLFLQVASSSGERVSELQKQVFRSFLKVQKRMFYDFPQVQISPENVPEESPLMQFFFFY
uniref:Uncharacterized protein n=1 Tax=Corvus moneduloides TaxID=1196302 RepID=A0A8C3DF38_CORMO